MNKEKALELLKDCLVEYGNDFIFHCNFFVELKEIILKNAKGSEKEVFNLLIKQFSFVKTMGDRVDTADSNEKLKGIKADEDYYSLHLQNKTVNIRLIMTFDGNIPVFLVAFFEREGKRVTDYSRWERVMKERYNQIRSEESDEQ